jgi:hypothetical protein
MEARPLPALTSEPFFHYPFSILNFPEGSWRTSSS